MLQRPNNLHGWRAWRTRRIDTGFLLASRRAGGQNFSPAAKWGIFIPSPLNEAAPITKGLLVNWKRLNLLTCRPSFPEGLAGVASNSSKIILQYGKAFLYGIDMQRSALLQWKSRVRGCVSMEFISLYSIRILCIHAKSFLVREKPIIFSSLRSKTMTLPGLTQATLWFEVHAVPKIPTDNLLSNRTQWDWKKGRDECHQLQAAFSPLCTLGKHMAQPFPERAKQTSYKNVL